MSKNHARLSRQHALMQFGLAGNCDASIAHAGSLQIKLHHVVLLNAVLYISHYDDCNPEDATVEPRFGEDKLPNVSTA